MSTKEEDTTIQNFKILETWAPMKWMHPTRAIVQDQETGEVYEWNSRAHRRMRTMWFANQDQQRPRQKIRFFRVEPHLISWWVTVSNMAAATWWVINGTFGLWPGATSSDERSAKLSWAAAIVAGFFLITTNYFTLVEAINNCHAEIRKPLLDKRRRDKRTFQRQDKVYGHYKSPINHNNHGVDTLKTRRHLLHAGFPYIEDPATGKLVTTDDYSRAISQYIEQMSTSVKAPDEENNHNDVEEGVEIPEVNSSNHPTTLIGRKVHINDSTFVCTTSVTEVSLNKAHDELLSRNYYDWWSWTPAWDHVGVISGYVGVLMAILYFIPMTAAYPLGQRDDVRQGVELFFIDLLQLITHLWYALLNHLQIAEAAGSWWKPKFNYIGYWIGCFNAVGSWGFCLTGMFLIPDTVNASCCDFWSTRAAQAVFIAGSGYFVAGVLMIVEFANPDPIYLPCGKKRPQDESK